MQIALFVDRTAINDGVRETYTTVARAARFEAAARPKLILSRPLAQPSLRGGC